MQSLKYWIALVLFATLCFGSSNAKCPPNSEQTMDAPCDYVCGVPCDYKGVTNVCICNDGYLKDPNTQQCVPESQCPIAPEVPVLRSDTSFSFSCFSS